MRITILGSGTSQGVPVIGCKCGVCTSDDSRDKRLRTSVLMQTDKVAFTIDAGPDFRQQMLTNKVEHLDAVIITHSHKDHIGGMDDIRSFNFLQKFSMPVYASEQAQEEIRREYSYAFEEHLYPGAPTYNIITLTEEPFMLGDLLIEPIRLPHFELTSYAFRIGNFAYVTDLSSMPQEAFNRLKGVEYLIIEALRKEKHYSHLCLAESLEIIEKLNVKHAWLTHVSHLMGRVADVNPTLPSNVELAYDNQIIEI